jgi:hypothetical protein
MASIVQVESDAKAGRNLCGVDCHCSLLRPRTRARDQSLEPPNHTDSVPRDARAVNLISVPESK